MTLTKLENIGFHAGNGGNIHVVNGLTPSPLRVHGRGVGFGPLRISPWTGSTVVIDELTFESAANDGLFSIFSGALGASTAGAFGTALVASTDADGGEDGIDPSDTRLTRRSFIIATGLSALFAGSVTAQTDEELYHVARFQLESSPRGIQIHVDDLVADYLPPDQKFYVEIDGTSVGSFSASDDSLTVNPGITGEVVISSDSAISFVDRIIARFTADDELHYTFNPVDSSFSTFTVDDEVMISDQPILVDPILKAGSKETLVKINGDVIPHADEEQGPLGYWYIRDGTALMYVVGESSPDSTLVDIRVNVGTVDKIRERF